MSSCGTEPGNSLMRVGYATSRPLTETGRELVLFELSWNLDGTFAVEREDVPGQARYQKHSTEALK